MQMRETSRVPDKELADNNDLYLGPNDFDTISMIAGERPDIGMFVSSTPTGKRSHFYNLCTNKALGYVEHYHPSMHNPQWCDQMEAEFREQLTEQGFVHEILAEFGTEESGVFDKIKLDNAIKQINYCYNELTFNQKRKCEETGVWPEMMIYDRNPAPRNIFRCMGVDFDKYQAGSSVVILDFDQVIGKFQVIKRVEVPRGEFSYDNAVKTIVRLNEIYQPAWIYCDRGAGEYQIEQLRIIGEEQPHTGLKHKVKGWQFKNTVDVMDPITKEIVKEPLKPFMVNQLALCIERERLVLSEYDKTMYDQLINYSVERISQSGNPVFTSENEHAVDGLGLAYLAFVLEFPSVANTVKRPTFSSAISNTETKLGQQSVGSLFEQSKAWSKLESKKDSGELPEPGENWVKVPWGSKRSTGASSGSWGRRGGSPFGRSTW